MKSLPFILVPLMMYKLLFTVWLGTILTYFNFEISQRLNIITIDIKEIIFYIVTYSLFILYIFFYFIIKKKHNIKRERNSFYESKYDKRHIRLSITIIVFLSIYILYLFIFDMNKLPIIYALNGDFLHAQLLRMQIQTHTIQIGIVYLSKVVFFQSLFLPIFLFIKLLTSKRKIFYFLFFISLAYSSFLLVLDMQKSYIILLLLLLSFIYLYFRGINIKLFLISISLLIAISSIISMVMVKDNNYEGLLYILDRIIFGQNQGMYYMLQFYEPSTKAALSDFYFSSSLGLDYVKPDEFILKYIYADITNLVNANTYYIGESWSYYGAYGLLFTPFIIVFILILYYLFFIKLAKYDFVLYSSLGLIFFSTLPIDQSLQFIIYQKYFLYFLFFAIIPLYFFRKINNIKKKRYK